MRQASLVAAVVVVSMAIAVAGCGSSKSSAGSTSGSASGAVTTATTHVGLAKTKFVLHAGLAFGAFHRYIYKPVKAGDLGHPLQHKLALAKAAIAAAFVYHELKLALMDAQSSPTLSKLVSPITALQARFAGLVAKLKSGQASPADVSQANGEVASIKSQASGAGQPIAEQAPAL